MSASIKSVVKDTALPPKHHWSVKNAITYTKNLKDLSNTQYLIENLSFDEKLKFDLTKSDHLRW